LRKREQMTKDDGSGLGHHQDDKIARKKLVAYAGNFLRVTSRPGARPLRSFERWDEE